MTYEAAVVGTGPPREERDESTAGMGMGYYHGDAYDTLGNCDLIACADLIEENAEAYGDRFEIGSEGVYTEHTAMLHEVAPDVVSVTTPPAAHADIVTDCAAAEVQAVHCEKPMAMTWAECRSMVDACLSNNVQLTFNHQRRFNPRYRSVKSRIDAGDIGSIRRIEITAPDLLDWGTHCFDLAGWYAGEPVGAWVIGQVNPVVDDFYGGQHGHHTETQGVGVWEYENGILGIAATGHHRESFGNGTAFLRIQGDGGVIEVGSDQPPRMRPTGNKDWIGLKAEENSGTKVNTRRGIEDLLGALDGSRTPELAANRALHATEIIYSIYESARRRGRVDCPLTIEDNPLEAMVEAGEIPICHD